ncbi:hypothetical protein D3C87_1778740 [compost metagenome]
MTASSESSRSKISAPVINSKLPGTSMIFIFSSCAPCFSNPEIAPFKRAPVISAFHCATTIPNLKGFAFATFMCEKSDKFLMLLAILKQT